ncbi:SCO6745 family protein [Streptosporangium saharense]|uniref:SCO6745 family protein n=1 Tax=Streptosporangium saharense TaxID=1706840 RepID=UPI003333523D
MNQARRLWEAVEPLHAVVYFTPEPARAARALGVPGWWAGYFTGRVAPLGPIDAATASAVLYGFAPGRVARALPGAWAHASPREVLAARFDAVRAVLDRALPAGRDGLERLAALLETAVGACRFEGRALAAGWSGVPVPSDVVGRVWLAATVLREHRGDGHVLAAVHAGLRGLDAILTHVATGAITRESIQISRGWSDEEWQESHGRLVALGLLDRAGGLTGSGERVRREIEEATDRLAADPVTALGEAGVAEVVALAAPLSRHLVDTGVIPVPNPIGAPRP